MTDPDSRGSSVAKLIQHFRHGQASDRSIRRKEIEELMWWHAKKSGRDQEAETWTVPDTSDAPTSLHTSVTNDVSALGDSGSNPRKSPDSAYDVIHEPHEKGPVQALLNLAKSNPSLYKALLNLQMSPIGTVSASSVSIVQQVFSSSQIHEPPRIASMRDANMQGAQVQPLQVTDRGLGSKNRVIAIDTPQLLSVSKNKLSDSDTELEPDSPLASLREWASGTCSPITRSSSPADRFAGLQVHLRSERQVQSSSERLMSRSISPVRVRTTCSTARNAQGEPYHPLARDYPTSSSAGSMWSPGVSPKPGQRSSMSAGPTAAASAQDLSAKLDAHAPREPVADDVMGCQAKALHNPVSNATVQGSSHDDSPQKNSGQKYDSISVDHATRNDQNPHEHAQSDDGGTVAAEHMGKDDDSPDDIPGPGVKSSPTAHVCSGSSSHQVFFAPGQLRSLSGTDCSDDLDVSSPESESGPEAEPLKPCTVGDAQNTTFASVPLEHNLEADSTTASSPSWTPAKDNSASGSPKAGCVAEAGKSFGAAGGSELLHKPAGSPDKGSEGRACTDVDAELLEPAATFGGLIANASTVADPQPAETPHLMTQQGGNAFCLEKLESDPGAVREMESQAGQAPGHEGRSDDTGTPLSAVPCPNRSSSPTHSVDSPHCVDTLDMGPGSVVGTVQLEGELAAAVHLDRSRSAVPPEALERDESDYRSSDVCEAVEQEVAVKVQPDPAYMAPLCVHQDTADACVQAGEPGSPTKARHNARGRKCTHSCHQHEGSAGKQAILRDSGHQGATLRTHDAAGVHRENVPTMSSTSSQTDLPGIVPNAVPRYIGSIHEDYKHTQLQHAWKQETCIQSWQPSALEVVDVQAPDPRILLAVQDVRARLEALNQEMANVMLHTTNECASKSPSQSETHALQSGTRNRDCAQTCARREMASTVLTERPCTIGWDVHAAADHVCSEHALPVRITVSVDTAKTDKTVYMPPGQSAWTQTDLASTNTILQAGAANRLLAQDKSPAMLKDKACQASGQGSHVELHVTESILPLLLASDPLQEESTGHKQDSCSDADVLCEVQHGTAYTQAMEEEKGLLQGQPVLPTGVQRTTASHAHVAACGCSPMQWQIVDPTGASTNCDSDGSRALADIYIPCVMDPGLTSGAGGMPWVYHGHCGAAPANDPLLGLGFPAVESSADMPTSLEGSESCTRYAGCEERARDQTSISSTKNPEMAGQAALYTLDGAPGSQIRPLMSSWSPSERTKHLKVL